MSASVEGNSKGLLSSRFSSGVLAKQMRLQSTTMEPRAVPKQGINMWSHGMGKRTASPRVSTKQTDANPFSASSGAQTKGSHPARRGNHNLHNHRHGKIASCYIFHRNDKPRDQDLRVQDALVIVVEPFYGNTVANARILCRPQELESEQFGNLR